MVSGCILTGRDTLFRKSANPGLLRRIFIFSAASVWIAPLITDSVIFFLTIYRTKHYLHHLLSPYVLVFMELSKPLSDGVPVVAFFLSFMSEAAARAIMILVRDGTMYFFLIFLSNLMNALIFFVRIFISIFVSWLTWNLSPA